jgi:uncharacterized coiled-coil protein SlyX
MYAMFDNRGGSFNTAIGFAALGGSMGNHNIALGYYAATNVIGGINNIHIGNEGVFGDNATIRIGGDAQERTYIAGIYGRAYFPGIPVYVNRDGQLGTMPASERFKDEIKPMDRSSEAILALKPVTFRYKKEVDPNSIPQFGLVAEDVEKVNPDLVVRDKDGKPYSVRYEAVNAMLLNEFLKEHRTMQELKSTAAKQEATVTQLKSTVAQQQKDFQAASAKQQEQIEALTAGLQRVSAQVEMSRPAPQMVVNNQ